MVEVDPTTDPRLVDQLLTLGANATAGIELTSVDQVNVAIRRVEQLADEGMAVVVPPKPRAADFESQAAWRWASLGWDRAFGDVALFEKIRLAGGRTVTCRHGYGFADSCPVCDSQDDPDAGSQAARAERAVRELVAKLTPGAKLPSERALSASLEVGRTTVRLVLGGLMAQGLIRAEHGRGYFVRDPASGSAG